MTPRPRLACSGWDVHRIWWSTWGRTGAGKRTPPVYQAVAQSQALSKQMGVRGVRFPGVCWARSPACVPAENANIPSHRTLIENSTMCNGVLHIPIGTWRLSLRFLISAGCNTLDTCRGVVAFSACASRPRPVFRVRGRHWPRGTINRYRYPAVVVLPGYQSKIMHTDQVLLILRSCN